MSSNNIHRQTAAAQEERSTAFGWVCYCHDLCQEVAISSLEAAAEEKQATSERAEGVHNNIQHLRRKQQLANAQCTSLSLSLLFATPLDHLPGESVSPGVRKRESEIESL